jgi:hypothetical protein
MKRIPDKLASGKFSGMTMWGRYRQPFHDDPPAPSADGFNGHLPPIDLSFFADKI